MARGHYCSQMQPLRLFVSPCMALLAKTLDTPALDGHQVQAPHLVHIPTSIYPLEFPRILGEIFGSTLLNFAHH